MKRLYFPILAIAALALLFPMVATAQTGVDKGRLPQTSSFHLDVRGLSLFNAEGIGLQRDDDPQDSLGIGRSTSGVGTSAGIGLKIGYLYNGRHDFGGHLYTYNNSINSVLDPENDAADETEWRNESGNYRVAGFYNYNWRINGWIMPYVGPVLGVDVDYTLYEDVDDEESKVQTIYVTPTLGVEGGVKLFPFEHVAFDMGLIATGGPTLRRTTYGDDELEDDDWSGAKGGLGAYAGVNIYF